WWLVTAPLALLLSAVPVALSTLQMHRSRQRTLMSYTPEFIRGPVVRAVGRALPKQQANIFLTGMAATEDLAKVCTPKTGIPTISGWAQGDIWKVWVEQDRERCLSTALAVPPSIGSGAISATSYDYGADAVTGLAGSETEISKRLTGNWS